MPAQSTRMWQPLSASLARLLVRLWPDHTKRWGLAFEAELSEITTPFASFRWLIGGFMLLTREWWKSFFRGWGRPVGVPAGGPLETFARNSSRVPRTPRIVTVLLLLAAAAILLHPEVRSSLRSTMRSLPTGYQEYRWEPSRWSTVRKLRKEAEKNRDPKLVAFLSLLAADDAERIRLADEAVARDPSLSWLPYQNASWVGDKSGHQWTSPFAGQVKRVTTWDPDNAAPRLFAAEIVFNNIVPERKTTAALRGQLSDLEQGAAGNPDWLAAMKQAFDAPKYDSYTTQQLQLIREVTEKYGVNDPDITLYILSRAHIPNLLNIRTYGNVLLVQGSQAEQQGNTVAAAANYWRVLRFSQRMRLDSRTLIEYLIAAWIGKAACEKLQPLLEKTGHADEAALVGFELAQWKASTDRAAFMHRQQGERVALAWAGFTTNLASIAILFLVLLVAVSLFVVWFRRRSPLESRGRFYAFACICADVAPLLLLLSCAALFFAYHPYAQSYRAYLTTNQPLLDLEGFEGLMDAAGVTHFLPQEFGQVVHSNFSAYYFWGSITLVLSLFAMFLIFRMALRRSTSRSVAE